MMELNSKQRKSLEKAAHDLHPVVIVGGAGLTEGVAQMIKNSIAAHELITVKFNEYKDEKRELIEEVCNQFDITLVRIIGNIAILYRQAEKPDDRKFDI